MPTSLHRVRTCAAAGVLACLAAVSACRSAEPANWLGTPEEVAPGVQLYRTSDQTLVSPSAPIAVSLLKIDPARARLESALSNDDVMGAERVDAIASRRNAIAAVNGGFFNIHNGEPVGLLKVAGELVSDTSVTKGAVAIRMLDDGRTELAFDQIAVRVTMTFAAGGREWSVPIDGVDTTRERGKVMLYTPSYHEDSDTAPGGVEWTLIAATGSAGSAGSTDSAGSGSAGAERAAGVLRVGDVRRDAGHTPIPRDGAVLSFGGLELPEALAQLQPGVAITLTRTWSTVHGLDADHLESADHVVNGAGLLKRDGRTLDNWESHERLSRAAFIDMRHPRTVIGVDQDGFIWLIAVDGRRNDFSVGMSFAELVGLADRLRLRDALNLDGGGSTTMVVKGAVVNRPTDFTGPRAVSDAIVVTLR